MSIDGWLYQAFLEDYRKKALEEGILISDDDEGAIAEIIAWKGEDFVDARVKRGVAVFISDHRGLPIHPKINGIVNDRLAVTRLNTGDQRPRSEGAVVEFAVRRDKTHYFGNYSPKHIISNLTNKLNSWFHPDTLAA